MTFNVEYLQNFEDIKDIVDSWAIFKVLDAALEVFNKHLVNVREVCVHQQIVYES
ncbi:hypothetical protein VB713_26985 [Anabaena cylindrica UHCC 0172]|uniref:hypothetical protein n=1 Tax=Anabaena cylindrica TaxID=1165 RepID=UPI002B1FC2FB|nr:hypothetical protein [Anabaena cylindrica]MEA5554578.1 hypothetical protein [Anabaena cylindrica UHCC 0172]